MKTFSEKSSSKDTLTRNRQGTNHKQVPVKISVPAFRSIPLIQRKAICPCDGGCPSCTNGGTIQPKLTIGQPNDKYEQEADRVADQIMRMPAPGGALINGHSSFERVGAAIVQTKPIAEQVSSLVQRKCSSCGDLDEEFLQTKEMPGHTPEVTPEIAANINALRGGGQPLPESARAFFEPRFGVDFSGVRVHVDKRAAQLAHNVNARAFTVGQDVVFGAGQYAPETSAGKLFLAHELAHTVQQAKARSMPGGPPSDIQKQGDCSTQTTPEAQWADQNPGKVFGVQDIPRRTLPSNELILWNYCVGESRLRPAHKARLKKAANRWNRLLVTGGKLGSPLRRDLKIKILGAASSSGSPTVNKRLALERAYVVRDFLKSQNIPDNLIIVEGVGSRFPLADETSPENMARNRRIEVFLFVPTPTIGDLGPTVGAIVSKLVINKMSRKLPPPRFRRSLNLFSRRAVGVEASADVTLESSVGPASIGFLQFLVKDVRLALYQSNNSQLLLDYARCFTNLPCRDVEQATSRFSYDSRSLFLGSPGEVFGVVSFLDFPGVRFPLRYPDPWSGPFVLIRYFWSMHFDVTLGVRSAGFLKPLQSASWGLVAAEEVDVSRGRTSGLAPVASVTGSFRPGGPKNVVSVEQAMAGKTCRFMARWIEAEGFPNPEERPCRPVETLA